jgi:hypothetical protein
MSPDVAISLGGVFYRLSAAGHLLLQDVDAPYRSFVHSELPARAPADAVSVRFSVIPSPSSDGRTIFSSSASWTILAEDGRRAFLFRQPDDAPLYVARFRPGDPEVSVLCSSRLVESRAGTAVLRSPFTYPLDQVVSMYLLNGRGLTVHAAGALVGGKGILLAGVSGAGKTTISRLAAGRPGWEPLSDDRVIVRLNGGAATGATVYGTPWPGEGAVAENRSGPLEWLVFLAQGQGNFVERLEPGQALERLLKTASIPWYDREYLPGALDACGRLVREVPAAQLTFRPDAGAVDAMEALLDGSLGRSR